MGLSAKLTAESDAKYVDLYSYWEKIQQHSPLSLASLALLPSSVRKTSTKVVYHPNESETKEFTIRFSLGKFDFFNLLQALPIIFLTGNSFFNVDPPRRTSFLTTIYGLYFSHHYTLHEKLFLEFLKEDLLY